MTVSAFSRICFRDFYRVLFNRAVFALVVQVTIMQIVDVVAMLNSGVFAIGAMFMVVIFAFVRHVKLLTWYLGTLPSRA